MFGIVELNRNSCHFDRMNTPEVDGWEEVKNFEIDSKELTLAKERLGAGVYGNYSQFSHGSNH